MNFEVKEIGYCQLSVHCEADAEKISNKRQDVLQEFKDVHVPGFRPGKATLEIVKMRYKKQIDERLKIRLAEDAYREIINRDKLKPLGNPKFTSIVMNDVKFECDFTFSKQPEFELTQYKEFEMPKPQQTLTATDLAEKMLQQIRSQHGQAIPFSDTDFAQTGDKIIVDYEASVDGNVITEACGTKEMIQIGSSPFAVFDENLLGMKMGETREFDIVSPDTAPEEHRGKTLHFKVTLAMGSKEIPAALDEALAAKLEFATLDELRSSVNSAASSRVQEYERTYLNQQAAKRLQETYTFQIPDWLLTAEAKFQANGANKDWETLADADKENFLKQAESAVRLTLVLDKIREAEPEAQLSDEEIVEQIKQRVGEMVASRQTKETSVDSVLASMNRSGMLTVLMGRIRDEHTLDFVVKTSKIIE